MDMKKRKPMHGTGKASGCSHARLGSFCRMFPDAPSWGAEWVENHQGEGEKTTQQGEAKKTIRQCEAEEIAAAIGGVGGLMHDAAGESEDSCIPAGYTFFAQFVDHDVTLDTTSPLHGVVTTKEFKKLANLRSASLDLDCVYGFGPEASPHLYDPSQHGRLLVGSDVDGIVNPDDVPRNQDGRALIGDPRNDENLFVSQLQLAFLKFHNRRLATSSFEKAQKETRYCYQSIVLYDFLKRICDPKVYEFALPKIQAEALKPEEEKKEYPFFVGVDPCGRICIPVEFSVAAYRFGHSLVRSAYPVNRDYPMVELFDERFGTLGFGQVPRELVVDWRFLVDMDECHSHVKSKAIDHLLADELMRLPDPVIGRNTPSNDRALAFRNILRGHSLGLPSGQTLATNLKKKYKMIDLGLGFEFDTIDGWNCLPETMRGKLEKITPLFFYLMREAKIARNGQRLGPVASAILMETFGAMFVYCDSFLKPKKDESCPKSEDFHEEPPKVVFDPKQVNPCDPPTTLAAFLRYANG